MKRLAAIILALLVVAGAAWYALTIPAVQDAVGICPTRAYIAETEPIFQEWSDASKLANSTPRSQLAGQITRLQEIRRQADSVTVYGCASNAHAAMTDMMDATIAGYTAFLSQSSDAVVSAHFRRSEE